MTEQNTVIHKLSEAADLWGKSENDILRLAENGKIQLFFYCESASGKVLSDLDCEEEPLRVFENPDGEPIIDIGIIKDRYFCLNPINAKGVRLNGESKVEFAKIVGDYPILPIGDISEIDEVDGEDADNYDPEEYRAARKALEPSIYIEDNQVFIKKTRFKFADPQTVTKDILCISSEELQRTEEPPHQATITRTEVASTAIAGCEWGKEDLCFAFGLKPTSFTAVKRRVKHAGMDFERKTPGDKTSTPGLKRTDIVKIKVLWEKK